MLCNCVQCACFVTVSSAHAPVCVYLEQLTSSHLELYWGQMNSLSHLSLQELLVAVPGTQDLLTVFLKRTDRIIMNRIIKERRRTEPSWRDGGQNHHREMGDRTIMDRWRTEPSWTDGGQNHHIDMGDRTIT